MPSLTAPTKKELRNLALQERRRRAQLAKFVAELTQVQEEQSKIVPHNRPAIGFEDRTQGRSVYTSSEPRSRLSRLYHLRYAGYWH